MKWRSPALVCQVRRRFDERPGFGCNQIHRRLPHRFRPPALVWALASAAQFYLASSLSAEIVLIDEERARRAAKSAGFSVAGSIAVLERGARLKKVADLRSIYASLLDQGIRFDHKILDQSLARLGLAELTP